MKELLKIAWRNLWRSKTRTLLTVLVVLFVVILSIASTSQQYGMYDNMINNVVEFGGHLQVQDTSYIKDKTINDALEIDEQFMEDIKAVNHVTEVIPRIESFSLASTGTKTKGVAVLGINPSGETKISKLDKKIARYKLEMDSTSIDNGAYAKLKELNNTSFISEELLRKRLKGKLGNKGKNDALINKLIKQSEINSEYLSDADKDVVVGEALADYLGLGLGDTLVMLSQGYHGATAAGLFRVKGFLKLPDIQLESSIVVMDIQQARQFYSTGNMATSVLVKIDKNNKLENAKRAINAILPTKYKAQTWKEMQPETLQMIDSDKAGGVFMKAIFYMIVGFIIFGTVMMMLSERRREFGTLIAIGLKRGKLALILFIETLFISFLGTFLGFVLSFPLVSTLHKNPIPLQGEMAEMMQDYGFEPIIYFSNSAEIFYNQAIIIFIVSVVIFMFPLIGLRRLNIIKAIRG